MSNQDRQPPDQAAEDMFGRPTDVRHEQEEPEGQPSREEQGAHQRPEEGERDDSFRKHCAHDAAQEMACGGIGEISDGDGVRSDLGTNPLPEGYWSAYPGKKPDTH